MNKPTLTIITGFTENISTITLGCYIKAINDPTLTKNFSLRHTIMLQKDTSSRLKSIALTDWFKEAKQNDLCIFIDAKLTFHPRDINNAIMLMGKHNASVVCGAFSIHDSINVVPYDLRDFYLNKEGKLKIGTSGFMLINKLTLIQMQKLFTKIVYASDNYQITPYFFPLLATVNHKNVWYNDDETFFSHINNINGIIYGFRSDTLGYTDNSISYVSNHISNELSPTPKETKTWGNNTIVVICASTNESWTPNDNELDESQIAIVQLTKLWKNKGYDITVFCTCSKEDIYDGVKYQGLDKCCFEDTYNILIIWKDIKILQSNDFIAKKCLLDLHDISNLVHVNGNVIHNVDHIFVKSKYHSTKLTDIIKVPPEKLVIMPNGGYEPIPLNVERNSFNVVYTSAIDKGLCDMLKYGWPLIQQAMPSVQFHICSGWGKLKSPESTSDKSLKAELLQLFKQPGIIHYNNLKQEQLQELLNESNIHYYVGTYPECDAYSIRQSISYGCIPIVSDNVPMYKEKDYCLLIEGDTPQVQQKNAANKIIELVKYPVKTENIRQQFIKSSLLHKENWNDIGNTWVKFF